MASATASKPQRPPSIAKTAGVGFAGGVLLWFVNDVLGEFTTMTRLREKGVSLAEQSDALKAQIGFPYSVGPWYQTTIAFSPNGHAANITFQLRGSKQITDVTVRAIRGPGWANRLAYNLFDSGHWSVIHCTAMFPDGNGLVQPRSLLPDTQPGTSLQATETQQTDKSATATSKATASKAEPGSSTISVAAQGAGGPTGRTWWGWVRGQPRSAITAGSKQDAS